MRIADEMQLGMALLNLGDNNETSAANLIRAIGIDDPESLSPAYSAALCRQLYEAVDALPLTLWDPEKFILRQDLLDDIRNQIVAADASTPVKRKESGETLRGELSEKLNERLSQRMHAAKRTG